MASNKDFKHNEFEIQRDLWLVFKEHYDDQSQEDANRAFAELNEVCTRYEGNEFCLAMAVAMNDQLMRRWNENHGTK